MPTTVSSDAPLDVAFLFVSHRQASPSRRRWRRCRRGPLFMLLSIPTTMSKSFMIFCLLSFLNLLVYASPTSVASFALQRRTDPVFPPSPSSCPICQQVCIYQISYCSIGQTEDLILALLVICFFISKGSPDLSLGLSKHPILCRSMPCSCERQHGMMGINLCLLSCRLADTILRSFSTQEPSSTC